MTKYRCRIPPCPDYDVPAMENWLEDMAAKGLHLSTDGFFGLFATFEEGPPRREFFRLEPTATNRSLFSQEYEPEENAVELHRQMGWEYRARRGQFHIYSTADPNAPELHTDPQIQAMTLETLGKFLRKQLIDTLLLLALYFVLNIGDFLPSLCVGLGTGWVALVVGLVLWRLIGEVRALVVLGRYRKQLRQGDPLPRPDKNRPEWVYPAAKVAKSALWIIAVVGIIGQFLHITAEMDHLPLEEGQDYPFATIQDFYPEARVDRDKGIMESEDYAWSDFLAPENHDYSEFAQVTLDGRSFDCSLYVDYHEMRTDGLADLMGRSLISQATGRPLNRALEKLFGKAVTEVTELPGVDADLAVTYERYHGMPYILLVRDNVVIRVQFFVFDGSTQPSPEELAQLVLSHIR